MMESAQQGLMSVSAGSAKEAQLRNLQSTLKAFNSEDKNRNEKLWEVSKGFETMFVSQLYKSLRKTVQYSELTKPSMGRKMFTEMLDEEYAKQSSGTSSASLAGMVYRYLVQKQGEESEQTGNNLPGAGKSPSAAARSYPGESFKVSENNLKSLINKASEKFGVDSLLIKSVIKQESGNKPYVQSKAGAKGLMQLMDTTAREMGVDNVYSPQDNVMGGTKYLKYLLDRYEGDEKLALAAYNAGPSRVDKYNGVPPFPETQKYVANVMAMKKAFKLFEQGEGYGSEK